MIPNSFFKIIIYILLLFVGSTACSEDPQKELVEEILPEEDKETDNVYSNLKLTIPDTIYAVVGTELNLWNDAVSLSVDKGLISPLNYQIQWDCDKGIITNRCFRFKPNSQEIGEYNCGCELYDFAYRIIDHKDFIIKVLPNDQVNRSFNCVYFGDSLGPNTVDWLVNNFNDDTRFEGIKPTFRGTKNINNKHHEAVGGYIYFDYATQGRNAYRIYVNNTMNLEIDAIYSINNEQYAIKEINITNGKGNLLLLYQSQNTVKNFPSSGVLTKISGAGDTHIHYKGGFQESNNPLWNFQKGDFDIDAYKTKIGLSEADKIDIVSFQFGINDAYLANNTAKLKEYIDNLYRAFTDNNSNCKVIIGMAPSAGNDVNGAGANYGASFDWVTYLNQSYRLRLFYLTLSKDEYPNLLIAPAHLGLDRYYGYAFSERPISDRNTEKEYYHNNYLHPSKSGYQQLADIYFASYIAAMMNK